MAAKDLAKHFMQVIYEEAKKRLFWGSCVKTGIAVLDRLGFQSDWMKKYNNNVDRITEALKEKAIDFRVDYTMNHEVAQEWANHFDGSYVVIATLVRYNDLVNKKGGNHHLAFVLPSDKIHHFPKIGGGGVRNERYILSDARVHFWYNPKNVDYMTYVRYGLIK